MKKFFSIVMMIAALTINVSAKDNNKDQQQVRNGRPRQEMNIEQMAKRMAQRLELDDKATEKFVPIYKSYREEKKAVMQKYAKHRSNPQLMSDEDVAKANKNAFERKRAMLDLEENYYKKFTKVLNERQYHAMKKMANHRQGARMGKAGRRGVNQPMQHHLLDNMRGNHFPMRPNRGMVNHRDSIK